MLSAVAEHRPDCLMGVSTMLIAVLDHPDLQHVDVGCIDLVLSGGAHVPAELAQRVEKAFGCRISTIYGQTELSPTITQTDPADPDPERLSTVGRPLDSLDVAVLDPVAGTVVPTGEQGEVCARGYQVMAGYYDRPDLTAATVDQDGWLHTGDLGTMDDRGYVRLTGRLKDMVIRGGENIFPVEIEEVLLGHPDVADAVVVGIPDPLWGERVAAVLRLRPSGGPLSAQLLRAHVRQHLAPAKTPTDWFVAEQFPLTGSGKIQKFRVLQAIRDGAYDVLS